MRMTVRLAAAFVAVFWNLENLFVPWGDGNELAADFRSGGRRGWNAERFSVKCNAVAKTLLYLEDSLGRNVDLFAVAEIEDRRVLWRLLRETPLLRRSFGFIHYDSPDRRGIDVALLYDSSRLKCLGSRQIPVGDLRTRSVLYACFCADGGDTLHVFVNHHPSKFSGASASQGARDAAMAALAGAADSVRMACPGHALVVTGDFNDVPHTDTLPGVRGMRNLAAPLHRRGLGTIKYGGRWEMIDHFAVTSRMLGDGASMYVFAPRFLLEKDRKFMGYKPRRTYVGPRYNGGVSDHLPVVLEFFY